MIEKPLEEWFKLLPKHLEIAIGEATVKGGYTLLGSATSLQGAIIDNFDWNSSREGHDFWNTVYEASLGIGVYPEPESYDVQYFKELFEI